MKKRKWILSSEELPADGMPILVKMSNDRVFYAIYSDYNEFDVHKPDKENDYRKCWYKYSKAAVLKWRYFNLKK